MTNEIECHGLDNPEQVFFYEQDFYVLSNFSAFNLIYGGHVFMTSEHAYQHARFMLDCDIPEHDSLPCWHKAAAAAAAEYIRSAPSAHEAFRCAQDAKQFQRPDWDGLKHSTMREILMAKVKQHEYVRRKLLDTGDRQLVENSWRDPHWGWGPDRNGENHLGRLWMSVRDELRQLLAERQGAP